MKWLFINLGTGDKALNLRMKIQEHFLGFVLNHGTSDEYCVLANKPLNNDGDVILYFPPALATFARSLGATQECYQPTLDSVGIESACDRVAALQIYYPRKENE